MGDNDKTFDSSPNQQLQSKPDRRQAWSQLTAKYLQDLPQQLDGIRAVLEIKDYTAVKKQAHRIKGTSGTYRLDTIAQSAAQLERVADSQTPTAIVATINKVMRLVELETDRLNSMAVSSVDTSERLAND